MRRSKVKREGAEEEDVKAWQKEDEARGAKRRRGASGSACDPASPRGLAGSPAATSSSDRDAVRAENRKLRADFNAAVEKLQQTMASIRANTSCLASGSGEIAAGGR